MFAILRYGVDPAYVDGQMLYGAPRGPPRLESREEVKYCNKQCQDYVTGWEKNQKIYSDPMIYENLQPASSWMRSPQP